MDQYVNKMMARVELKLGRIYKYKYNKPIYPNIKGLVPDPLLESKLWRSIAANEPEKTITIADEIIKDYPRNENALFEKSRAFAKLGKYEEALILYKLALESGYHYKDYLHYETGLCLERLNRLEEALEAYNLADACGRGCGPNGEVAYAISRVLLKLNRFRSRYKNFPSSINKELDDRLWRSIAENKPKEIIKIADKLIDYGSNYANLYFDKARAFAQLGRYQAALILFETALKNQYEDLDLLYYEKGICLEYLGRLKEAHLSFNKSIDEGGNGMVFDAIDRVLLKLEKLDKVSDN